MGVGCSLCGPVVDETSYDLTGARNQPKRGRSSAFAGEEKESEPNIQPPSQSENSGSAKKEVVSQSQCEVIVTDSANVQESGNIESENSINSTRRAKDEETTDQGSSSVLGSLETEKHDNTFRPGHVSHGVINTDEEQTRGHAKTSTRVEQLKTLGKASEEEIQGIVERCWEDIENSCQVSRNTRTTALSTVASKVKGWRAVRLFVSSTFSDYHAEREVLVKKVVPELREWCEERLIHLIECDLRWGVPKDSTTESTIRICLGEIDRCYEETNGEPFFLNMLGERYGWIPSFSEVSQEIQEEYKWIFPTSITHMEIIHAAYRIQSQNSAFLIRSSEFLNDIPPGMIPAFIDDHPLSKAHLKALKEKLRQRFPGQVFDYSCQYDGVDESSGRPKVKLKGLDEFGQSVIAFFKSAISRSFPEEPSQLSAKEIEKTMHENFAELRGQLVLGRSEEISAIIDYARSGTLPGGCKTEGLLPLIVLGSSGSGKSSLMAHCTLQIKKLELPLFYHFVGAGPGSLAPHKLVERLVRWLKDRNPKVTPEDLAAVENMSSEQLKNEIKKELEELAKSDESFVIIIDAVNQLADSEASAHMDWLPNVFPNNVHCIISAVTDSRSSRLLSNEHRTPSPVPLHIRELDKTTRGDIVKHTLGKYNKTLDTEQMELLIGSSGAANPLWLSLACEELRVFGVFETITHHIKSLPGTLKELLQLIINRLTKEDESSNVQKVLCLLVCSQGGLSETELRDLLSGNPAEPLPMMRWAEVRRTLKAFLRNISSRVEQERLDFFHASIPEVVLETILVDPEERKKWHSELADYFVNHCKDEDRVVFMVPQQLKLAGEKKRLLDFVRKDQRSVGRPGFWKNNYYKDLRCNRLLQENSPFSHEVHMCQFCSMRRGGFGDMTYPNKDSCFICGRFTPWKDKPRAAMVCQWHKPPLGPPNIKMCFICKKPAFQNASSAFLCPMCGNLGIKKCAMLVAE